MKPVEPGKPTGSIKVGDLVTITGSTYYGGKSIPGWVKKLCWYVVEVSGDRAVINKDESGRYAIMSPVKTSALAVAGTKPSEDYRIHTVVHGDTLWAIAKKYLGNGSRYKEIVSLNGLKSNVIYKCKKLRSDRFRNATKPYIVKKYRKALQIKDFIKRNWTPITIPIVSKLVSSYGASGDTELFEKASNINGFQGGRVANNLYISPFRATVFQTAALFLYPNSSVVIRVEKLLFLSL